MKKRLASLFLLSALAFNVHSTLFYFDLTLGGRTGAVGVSLHQVDPDNYPLITLDTGNHTLRLPVAWGSVYIPGNTDLRGEFLTAEIVYDPPGLSGMNPYTPAPPYVSSKPSGVSGYFDTLIPLNNPPGAGYSVADQESDLNAGRWEVLLRTWANQGGEIRGRLVPIPEPGGYSILFCAFALAAGGFGRRLKEASVSPVSV